MKQIRQWLLLWASALILGLSGCSAQAASLPSSAPAPTAAAVTAETSGEAGLKVHFIDVGQGDSILAESDGHYLLIDGGENDQAERVISYLEEQGATSLDYVIGTHPHSDHIGGLDGVIQAMDVQTVMLAPVEHTTQTFEDVLDAVSDKGLSLTLPQLGDTYSLGDASFTIIAPAGDYGDDLNNWSVGIRLVYQDTAFVLCGDAEAQAEADMCASGLELSADVLKAGHHGSSTSSSDVFLDKVHPSYMVISCGQGNSYGHPHQETLDKAASRGIQVYRTDLEGTIVASSDGQSLSWSFEKEEPADESSPSLETTYILNTNTRKFHLPDCGSAAQIQEQNRQEWTGSRQELIDQGYSPCGQCRP